MLTRALTHPHARDSYSLWVGQSEAVDGRGEKEQRRKQRQTRELKGSGCEQKPASNAPSEFGDTPGGSGPRTRTSLTHRHAAHPASSPAAPAVLCSYLASCFMSTCIEHAVNSHHTNCCSRYAVQLQHQAAVAKLVADGSKSLCLLNGDASAPQRVYALVYAPCDGVAQ